MGKCTCVKAQHVAVPRAHTPNYKEYAKQKSRSRRTPPRPRSKRKEYLPEHVGYKPDANAEEKACIENAQAKYPKLALYQRLFEKCVKASYKDKDEKNAFAVMYPYAHKMYSKKDAPLLVISAPNADDPNEAIVSVKESVEYTKHNSEENSSWLKWLAGTLTAAFRDYDYWGEIKLKPDEVLEVVCEEKSKTDANKVDCMRIKIKVYNAVQMWYMIITDKWQAKDRELQDKAKEKEVENKAANDKQKVQEQCAKDGWYECLPGWDAPILYSVIPFTIGLGISVMGPELAMVSPKISIVGAIMIAGSAYLIIAKVLHYATELSLHPIDTIKSWF